LACGWAFARDRHTITTYLWLTGAAPSVEAFFTTALSLSTDAILSEYSDRWAVEIAIREANAFEGLGQDQCWKRRRIIGANTFRFVMAAARTLWFLD